MALKAGYVGVKRWCYEKIVNTVKSVKADTANLFKTNVKNLYACEATTTTDAYDLTWTVSGTDSNQITVSGTPTGFTAYNTVSHNILPPGKYILSGAAGVTNATYNALILRSGTTTVVDLHVTSTDEFVFTIPENVSYDNILLSLKRKTNAVACSGTFKLMIRAADIDNDTYVPFAKTNYQLTGDITSLNGGITTLEGVDDAHKTTINGIISAATGAADFTAFKTAMAALTPLTRSEVSDTREAIPEVVEDPEPVTRKTTTKKSTKEDN